MCGSYCQSLESDVSLYNFTSLLAIIRWENAHQASLASALINMIIVGRAWAVSVLNNFYGLFASSLRIWIREIYKYLLFSWMISWISCHRDDLWWTPRTASRSGPWRWRCWSRCSPHPPRRAARWSAQSTAWPRSWAECSELCWAFSPLRK